MTTKDENKRDAYVPLMPHVYRLATNNGYRACIVGEYPEPTERDAPPTIKVQVLHPLSGDVWSGEIEWCGVDADLADAHV
tara:strand:+ start:1095 stop:1334 length:240 start_codon:yes stop_codon:yes gene_type:complete